MDFDQRIILADDRPSVRPLRMIMLPLVSGPSHDGRGDRLELRAAVWPLRRKGAFYRTRERSLLLAESFGVAGRCRTFQEPPTARSAAMAAEVPGAFVAIIRWSG